jgi:N-acetylmuramoyl-L-alanine amidase
MKRLIITACVLGIWPCGAFAQVPWPDAPKDMPAETVCLAQNIYWEARSEHEDAQRAVSHMVLNRVANSAFPDSVCRVIRDGGPGGACQFSWYCDGLSDTPFNATAWALAVEIAQDVLAAPDQDPTGGALFYHHTSVDPGWSDVFHETVRMGEHIFYARRQNATNQDQ